MFRITPKPYHLSANLPTHYQAYLLKNPKAKVMSRQYTKQASGTIPKLVFIFLYIDFPFFLMFFLFLNMLFTDLYIHSRDKG